MKTCHTWLLCVWLAFPALATRQVVDDAGHTVTVPTQVQRIADSWFAHHSVLMTLGAGRQIVATVNHPQSQPWMFKINPSLNQALQIHGTSFNSEALLALHTDVLFVAKGKGMRRVTTRRVSRRWKWHLLIILRWKSQSRPRRTC